MSIEAYIVDGPLQPQAPDPPPQCGAVLEFRGVVRPTENGRELAGLRYEAYEPMATRALGDLLHGAAMAHGVRAARLIHSRGFVPAGRISLWLCVATPHRAEGLRAMAEIIDRLKQQVPIWKHPVWRHEHLTSQPATSEWSIAEHDIQTPAQALAAFQSRLTRLGTEQVDLSSCVGRVLAEALIADRDSPAIAVSAMDGYAVIAAEAQSLDELRLGVAAAVGQPPVTHQPGTATPIVTGAAIPRGADAIVQAEHAIQRGNVVAIGPEHRGAIQPGKWVRQAGENARGGTLIVEPGRVIHAGVVAALASFGVPRPVIYRRVRLATLVTGDEVLPVTATPAAWQLRDANGPAIFAAMAAHAWIAANLPIHVADEPDAITRALTTALDSADAVVITGGVSQGPRDYVPASVRAAGAEVLFHQLRQRPGKPMLAALRDNQPIFALPGNPVSVLATLTTLVLPTLRVLAGAEHTKPPRRVTISSPDDKELPLWWHRLVMHDADTTRLADGRGSGDVVAAARSDGIVQLPPRGRGHGPWPFHPWPGADA